VYDDARISGIKLPPHSREAEQAVVGTVLLHGLGAYLEVSGLVTARDFYGSEHRVIWQACAALADAGEPIDYLTVSTRVEREGVRGFDATLLLELIDAAPGMANLTAYADIVRRDRESRDLIDTAGKIADIGFSRSADGLDQAQGLVMSIATANARGEPKTMRESMRSWVDLLDRRRSGGATGATTGHKRLDDRWGGMNPGDVIVIGARPAMGKTSMAMQIASNLADTEQAAEGKGAVLVFSLEMGSDQLLDREMSRRTQIPLPALRGARLADSDWPKLSVAMTKSRDVPLLIDDTAPLSITEIRARARRVHRRTPLRLIVIDYLQLVDAEGHNANDRVSNISRQTKLLAKELSCPVMVLSQLNRDLEKRPNKRPTLADLRDSGAVEQDADVVLMLYRDEVYNPNSQAQGLMELITAKVRQGATGTDWARTYLERCYIEPINDDHTPPVEAYHVGREHI
jgi:replicative DNA helicase